MTDQFIFGRLKIMMNHIIQSLQNGAESYPKATELLLEAFSAP